MGICAVHFPASLELSSLKKSYHLGGGIYHIVDYIYQLSEEEKLYSCVPVPFNAKS